MTIQQSGVVDWLGIEKGTGCISLTLVDDLDWANEQAHLLALQEKLNTYLAFIESGEVYERLAKDIGRQVPTSTPIKVGILARYATTSRAGEFLNHAQAMFKKAGFELTFKVVKE